MSRTRIAVVAGVVVLLAGIAVIAAVGALRPVALVLPLVDLELLPVPSGLRVVVLEYGKRLVAFTLPIWPLVALLMGVGVAAIWWPLPRVKVRDDKR